MEGKLYFRRTEERDLDAVIEIVDAAKEYLRLQGIPQWQDGYPNRESFYKDIEREISYVLEENGKILGTIAIDLEGDRNYNWIYEGNWLSEKQPYAAIHRVAVDAERKGSGKVMFRKGDL